MDGVTQRIVWEAAALMQVAHYCESAWSERIPRRVWDSLHEDGCISNVTDPTGEQIPFLTEKGQNYLRELLAADK